DGVGEVVDFMPPAGGAATANHRLVRMLHCVRGRMTFEVEVAPRFDYGRGQHRTELTDHGALFTADGVAVALHVVREPGNARLAHVKVTDNDVRGTIDLRAGDIRGVMVETAPAGPPR